MAALCFPGPTLTWALMLKSEDIHCFLGTVPVVCGSRKELVFPQPHSLVLIGDGRPNRQAASKLVRTCLWEVLWGDYHEWQGMLSPSPQLCVPLGSNLVLPMSGSETWCDSGSRLQEAHHTLPLIPHDTRWLPGQVNEWVSVQFFSLTTKVEGTRKNGGGKTGTIANKEICMHTGNNWNHHIIKAYEINRDQRLSLTLFPGPSWRDCLPL